MGEPAPADPATGAEAEGETGTRTQTETDAGTGTEPEPAGPDPGLLPWALASFHTATLVVGGLFVLSAVGALGSLLQGVRTATGLFLYLGVWGITWRTNRRWLVAADLRTAWGTAVPGARWGAVTGLGVLLLALLVVGVTVREPLLVAAVALVGTPLSMLVGGVVGAAFALFDRLIVAAGRRIAGADRERTPEGT
jgi:hypothetical protein